MIGKQGIEQIRPELSTHDTALTAVQTDIGDFSGRNFDKTLLEVIGIPDTDGKDLHTLLVTDLLANGTHGLAQLESLLSAITAAGPTNSQLNTAIALTAQIADGWDSALATIMDNFTAARIGYLDELDFDLTAAIGAIPTTVLVATGVGVTQIKAATISLDQAASTYDLFTGTSQAVILESLNIKMPTGNAGGSISSISIQTDDVTPGVILNSTDGAVGNLLSEADLSWTGSLYITVATKIRLTIAGGPHGSAYTCQVTAKCRAVVAGGNLA